MLDSSTLSFIKSTVRKHLPPDYKAFIFGSHIIGNNRKWSDIDIGILGASKLPTMTFFDLEEELEESNLPYKVDLVDFTQVTDKFKHNAMKNTLYLN